MHENPENSRLTSLQSARELIEQRLAKDDIPDYAVANLVRELRQVLAEIDEVKRSRPNPDSPLERLQAQRAARIAARGDDPFAARREAQ